MASILLWLGACVSPTPSDSSVLPIRAYGIALELPPELETWREVLHLQIEEVGDRLDAIAHPWPVELSSGGHRGLILMVPVGEAASKAVSATLGQEQGWTTALTLPDLRRALVPLPWADRLLTAYPQPPRSWLETFRHECVHLMSLDRPALRAAPSWFQEGLAESLAQGQKAPVHGQAWARRLRDQAAVAGDRQVLQAIAALPAEDRYSAWAAMVRWCLEGDSGVAPWHLVSGLELAEWLSALPPSLGQAPLEQPPFLRGREADFPDPTFGQRLSGALPDGGIRLAAWPGQTVRLDWADWDGSQAWECLLRVGASGDALAGWEWLDATGHRLVAKQNTFAAAAVVKRDTDSDDGPQAFRSRLLPARAGRARAWRLERRGDVLWVESGDLRQAYSVDWSRPLRLRFWVRAGVAEWRAVR